MLRLRRAEGSRILGERRGECSTAGDDFAVTTGFEPGATIAGRHLTPELMQTLRDTATKTGVDFDFLVAQASVESGFRSKAHAARSTAAGIFQFTGPTWLQMMREHGAKYGYVDLAAAVKPTANGTVGVADKATQQRILALRQDDRLSALFAAEYAKSNAARLENATNHRAPGAELLIAHLLGPSGAGPSAARQSTTSRRVSSGAWTTRPRFSTIVEISLPGAGSTARSAISQQRLHLVEDRACDLLLRCLRHGPLGFGRQERHLVLVRVEADVGSRDVVEDEEVG